MTVDQIRNPAQKVVVLGMHKSGTTLVSELIHRSGIAMVEEEGNGDYDRGDKWERQATLALNKTLLGAGDVDSLDLPFALPAGTSLDDARERTGALVATLDGEPWGFKDPRTVSTWPAWAPYLADAHVVAVTRSLPALVRHYAKRRSRRTKKMQDAVKAVRAWTHCNEALRRICDEHPAPVMRLRYEDLMSGDAVFERLGEFLGRPLVDVRRTDRFRNRTGATGTTRLASILAFPTNPGRPERLREKLEAEFAANARGGGALV